MKHLSLFLSIIFLVFESSNHAFCYKAVILVPGLLSKISRMNILKTMILNAHPGTNVTIIDLYPGVESFVPLDNQLPHWHKRVKEIMDNSPNGVHLICHSQGGLVCQGIIETTQHNVHTFIGLSSPLNGQFGIPHIIMKYAPWFKNILRENLTRYMYKTITQDTFSVSNYWKDPRTQYHEKYLNMSHYLPFVHDHPASSKMAPHEKNSRKKNFLKLKQVVLVGGPDDGVIEPWQSSLYGFYNDKYDMINCTHQKVYLEDWFGLRTLDKQGRLKLFAIPGVNHTKWHKNETVFRMAIEPYLI